MTTTPATQALLPVTQSDRDAVCELMAHASMRFWYGADIREEIGDGKHDGNIFVQAFARHRQALTPSALSGDAGEGCNCPARAKGSHHYMCASYVPRDADSHKKRPSHQGAGE